MTRRFESGNPWREMAEGLPGRTAEGTDKRGGGPGLTPAPIPWTWAEEAALRAGSLAGKIRSRIAQELPGRTAEAMSRRAVRLGLCLR
jgi:hypothetical protein